MAGRKAIFDRDEQRKNQVVVPMSENERKLVEEAAKKMTAAWHRLSEWC